MTFEQAYPGAEQGQAPDLTLVLFDHGFFSVLDAEPMIWQRPEVAGTHAPEGVFAACGPGIAQGQQLPQQTILDVAATLLHSLGLPIPEDFESRVMTDVFEADTLAAQPVLSGPATVPPGGSSTDTTDKATDEEEADSEEKILERLRALGYVE